jgi:hypothetical protein
LLVVTLLGCWLGYHLNWIRERHELVAKYDALFEFENNTPGADHWAGRELESDYLQRLYSTDTVRAPWPLWMLGETGAVRINVVVPDDDPESRLHGEEEYDKARRLFPEALDVVGFIIQTAPRNPGH